MQFQSFLQSCANDIEKTIEDFFIQWNKEIVHVSPQLTELVKKFGDASKDGKRVRGTLVILGYILTSKVYTPELLKIALAYELFQTAILAHDDIIDNSPKRRGKPSLHMAIGEGEYGRAQAICLGDIGFFLAYKLISESNFDDTQKLQATAFFAKSNIKTAMGELLDVALSYKKTEVTQKKILMVSQYKTAYYTFVGPLCLGAILAGAEETFLKKLETYGEAVGTMYQLQDDIEDIFGTEKSLKKKIGGDILEGKQTVLYLKAQESATKKQLELLKTLYGNPKAKTEDIEAIKQVLQETGALDYTKGLINQYAEKARAIVPDLTPEESAQTMLNEVIDFVLRKESK